MKSRIPKNRWLGVAAALLALLVIAACASDPTPTPDPTPEPTATPAPSIPPTATPVPPTAAPEPTPEPAAPAMSMRDLRITPDTTGGEVIAHISEAEAACISSTAGDANYQLFQTVPLFVMLAADERSPGLFVACLESDNLAAFSAGLISVKLGGLSDHSLGCATDLFNDSPMLAHITLGVEDAASGTGQASILDMYECFDYPGKLAMLATLAFNTDPDASFDYQAPLFSGQQLLAVLPEDEMACLQTTLPEPLLTMIANASTVAETEVATAIATAVPQIASCVSPDTFSLIDAHILANGVGITHPDSLACVIEFTGEHGNLFGGLLNQAVIDPMAMSPEGFVQLADATLALIGCMNAGELDAFQELVFTLLGP